MDDFPEITPDDSQDVLDAAKEVLDLVFKRFDPHTEKGSFFIINTLMSSLAAFASVRFEGTESNIMGIANAFTSTLITAFRNQNKEQKSE
jgi:hypothetical protein